MVVLDNRRFEQDRSAQGEKFEDKRDIPLGYIIEVNGSIEGDRPELLWFRAVEDNAPPFQVYYDGVLGDLRPNMLCEIERDPKEPSRWKIRRFYAGFYFEDEATYNSLPNTSFLPDKRDYEWPPGHPGSKALNIFPRAVADFAVRPTIPNSMKVRVFSGVYPGPNIYQRFEGPVNSKDFTLDVPALAGLARLVAISVDSEGGLRYYNGSTFVSALPMPAVALPSVPSSQLLISAIRLVNGMTAISEINFDLELRPLFGPGGLAQAGSLRQLALVEGEFDFALSKHIVEG